MDGSRAARARTNMAVVVALVVVAVLLVGSSEASARSLTKGGTSDCLTSAYPPRLRPDGQLIAKGEDLCRSPDTDPFRKIRVRLRRLNRSDRWITVAKKVDTAPPSQGQLVVRALTACRPGRYRTFVDEWIRFSRGDQWMADVAGLRSLARDVGSCG